MRHEFIELYNEEQSDTDLSGWLLYTEKGLRFEFPPNTVMPSMSHLIIAQNVAAFKALYSTEAPVIGGYEGELSNGGDSIALVDSNQRCVQCFEYNDKGDWPHGADALGASERWLPNGHPFKNEYAKHVFKVRLPLLLSEVRPR